MELAQLELFVTTEEAEANVEKLTKATEELNQTLDKTQKVGASATKPIQEGARKAVESVRKTAVESKNLMDRLGGVKTAFAGIGGYLALRSIKSVVAEFAAADDAIARLNGTLRATGQYSTAYSTSLQNQAAALQSVTKYSDEMVMSVQQQLVMFGATRENVGALTELTLDFAAAMGMDAAGSAVLLGKAMQGSFEMFGRYGVKLDDTMTQQEKMNAVLQTMSDRSRGLAREMGSSLAGQLAQSANAWSDLKEEAGKFILTIGSPLIQDVTSIIKDLTVGAQKLYGVLHQEPGEGSWFWRLMSSSGISMMGNLSSVMGSIYENLQQGKGLKESVEQAGDALYKRIMGLDKAIPAAQPGIPNVKPKISAAELEQSIQSLDQLERQILSLQSTARSAGMQVESDMKFEDMYKQLLKLASATEMSDEAFDGWTKQLLTAQDAANATIERVRELENLQKTLFSLRKFSDVGSTMMGNAASLNAAFGVGRMPSVESMIQTQRSAVGQTRTVEDFQAETAKLELLMQERERRLSYNHTKGADAFIAGWSRAVESFETSSQRMARVGEGFASSLDQHMTDAFDGIIMGTESAEEAFANMTRAIVADLVRIMVQQLIVRQILSTLGAVSWFGGGGSAGAGAGGGTFTATGGEGYVGSMHKGGTVGNPESWRVINMDAFQGAPRFGGGGVAGDEVPIVAHRGEVVSTREQFADMMKGLNNRQNRVEIVNVVDPTMIDDRLNSNPGAMVNVISRNKTMFRAALGLR